MLTFFITMLFKTLFLIIGNTEIIFYFYEFSFKPLMGVLDMKKKEIDIFWVSFSTQKKRFAFVMLHFEARFQLLAKKKVYFDCILFVRG
jgi:hypothetical protein